MNRREFLGRLSALGLLACGCGSSSDFQATGGTANVGTGTGTEPLRPSNILLANQAASLLASLDATRTPYALVNIRSQAAPPRQPLPVGGHQVTLDLEALMALVGPPGSSLSRADAAAFLRSQNPILQDRSLSLVTYVTPAPTLQQIQAEPTKEQIIAHIKNMTVVQLSKLVQALEQYYGQTYAMVIDGESELIQALNANPAPNFSPLARPLVAPALIPQQQVLAAVQNGGSTILDARSPEEFSMSHISGAMNLPSSLFFDNNLLRDRNETFDLLVQAGLSRTDQLIVYSQDVFPALRVSSILVDLGFSSTGLYFEGFSDWTQSGLPVEP